MEQKKLKIILLESALKDLREVLCHISPLTKEERYLIEAMEKIEKVIKEEGEQCQMLN